MTYTVVVMRRYDVMKYFLIIIFGYCSGLYNKNGLDKMQNECIIQKESLFTYLQEYHDCVLRKTLPCRSDVINYDSSVVMLYNYCAYIDEMKIKEVPMTWMIHGGPAIQIDFELFFVELSFYGCVREKLSIFVDKWREEFCGHRESWIVYKKTFKTKIVFSSSMPNKGPYYYLYRTNKQGNSYAIATVRVTKFLFQYVFSPISTRYSSELLSFGNKGFFRNEMKVKDEYFSYHVIAKDPLHRVLLISKCWSLYEHFSCHDGPHKGYSRIYSYTYSHASGQHVIASTSFHLYCLFTSQDKFSLFCEQDYITFSSQPAQFKICRSESKVTPYFEYARITESVHNRCIYNVSLFDIKAISFAYLTIVQHMKLLDINKHNFLQESCPYSGLHLFVAKNQTGEQSANSSLYLHASSCTYYRLPILLPSSINRAILLVSYYKEYLGSRSVNNDIHIDALFKINKLGTHIKINEPVKNKSSSVHVQLPSCFCVHILESFFHFHESMKIIYELNFSPVVYGNPELQFHLTPRNLAHCIEGIVYFQEINSPLIHEKMKPVTLPLHQEASAMKMKFSGSGVSRISIVQNISSDIHNHVSPCEGGLRWMLLIIYDVWLQFPPMRRYGISTLHLNQYHATFLTMEIHDLSWWYFVRVWCEKISIVSVSWPISRECSVSKLSIEQHIHSLSVLYDYLDASPWIVGSEKFDMRIDGHTAKLNSKTCALQFEVMEQLGNPRNKEKRKLASKERILHKYRFCIVFSLS